jgi:hypothetical protein
MSQSNAAAIKRRANPPLSIQQQQQQRSVQPNQQQQQQQQRSVQPNQQQSLGSSNNMNAPGLTLPQVIALIDRRLINLETFVKESKENSNQVKFENNIQTPLPNTLPENAFEQLVEEFSHRFEVLAEELSILKDTVLKLQTYTMDVNKALLEERIQIFSDLGTNQQSNDDLNIDMENLEPIEITENDNQPNIFLSEENDELRNLVKSGFSDL